MNGENFPTSEPLEEDAVFAIGLEVYVPCVSTVRIEEGKEIYASNPIGEGALGSILKRPRYRTVG